MIKVKNKVFLGTLAAFLANLIFGFSNMFSSIALKYAHPFLILTLRFTIAFSLLLILYFTGACKLNLKGKNLLYPVLLGIFQPFVHMICELYGISLTSSAVSGVMISLSPVLVAVFSGVFLGERPNFKQFISVIVAFIGVAGIALFSSDGKKTYFIGIMMLLGAAVTAAAFNIFGRKISNDYTPFERTFVTFFVSTIGFHIILPFVLKGDYKQAVVYAFSSSEFVISIIYLAVVSSVAAFLLYNFAVTNISAVIASSFSNIISVVSVLAGVFILKEKLTTVQIIGSVLIIVGVWGVNKFKEKREKDA